MHREIKIKQFPIVTTHWWPKTRNERFVWENEQYLYSFLPLVHNHVQVIWVHTHPVCDACVRALWLVGVNAWRRACLKCGADATFHSYNNQSHTSLVLHELDWVFAWGDLIGWCLRWRLKSCVSTTLQTRPPSSVDADEPERAHTRALWLVVHTCSYDGELFNFDFSVHVLFPSYRDGHLYLPLYDWQTRTVWPKNIKIGSTEEKKTPTSWMPLG